MPSFTTAQAAAQAIAATDILTGPSIVYGFIVWFMMTVPLTWLARHTQPYASPALLSGLSVCFIVCAFEAVAVGGQYWQTGEVRWFMAHLPYFGLAGVDGAAVACGVALANWLYDRHVRRLTRKLARDGLGPGVDTDTPEEESARGPTGRPAGPPADSAEG